LFSHISIIEKWLCFRRFRYSISGFVFANFDVGKWLCFSGSCRSINRVRLASFARRVAAALSKMRSHAAPTSRSVEDRFFPRCQECQSDPTTRGTSQHRSASRSEHQCHQSIRPICSACVGTKLPENDVSDRVLSTCPFPFFPRHRNLLRSVVRLSRRRPQCHDPAQYAAEEPARQSGILRWCLRVN
jgi:hypothetical protein